MLHQFNSKFRTIFIISALCLLLVVFGLTIFADTFQVTNPIVLQRADPSVYKHTDGYYYFTGSVPSYDKVEIAKGNHASGTGFGDSGRRLDQTLERYHGRICLGSLD